MPAIVGPECNALICWGKGFLLVPQIAVGFPSGSPTALKHKSITLLYKNKQPASLFYELKSVLFNCPYNERPLGALRKKNHLASELATVSWRRSWRRSRSWSPIGMRRQRVLLSDNLWPTSSAQAPVDSKSPAGRAHSQLPGWVSTGRWWVFKASPIGWSGVSCSVEKLRQSLKYSDMEHIAFVS